MKKITQQVLKRHIFYDPDTGVFTWIVPTNRRIKKGGVAGSPHSKGYTEIQILGQREYAHRLAWLYMTGAWPANEIDHRNRVKDDNRWENLRDTTGSVNQQNRVAAQSNSSTGMLGVLVSGNGRYCARIRAEKKNTHLGSFSSASEAHAAYLAAKKIHHPDGVQ